MERLNKLWGKWQAMPDYVKITVGIIVVVVVVVVAYV